MSPKREDFVNLVARLMENVPEEKRRDKISHQHKLMRMRWRVMQQEKELQEAQAASAEDASQLLPSFGAGAAGVAPIAGAELPAPLRPPGA